MVTQKDVAERAKAIRRSSTSSIQLYANTGIERRYACEPREWYLTPHSWEERSREPSAAMRSTCSNASRGDAVTTAGLGGRATSTCVVVNTITGIAVPSLDARLIDRMEFRSDVERLPIFGFGCGGGVAGLSRAARLAQSMPDANVLFLTIDLCSLCLRIDDPSIEMFVSAALFGDGAVGVVLRGEPKGARSASRRPRPRIVRPASICGAAPSASWAGT